MIFSTITDLQYYLYLLKEQLKQRKATHSTINCVLLRTQSMNIGQGCIIFLFFFCNSLEMSYKGVVWYTTANKKCLGWYKLQIFGLPPNFRFVRCEPKLLGLLSHSIESLRPRWHERVLKFKFLIFPNRFPWLYFSLISTISDAEDKKNQFGIVSESGEWFLKEKEEKEIQNENGP